MAITAAVHRAFYKMISEKEKELSNIQSRFVVNSQRYCNPKPSEDYHGVFVYLWLYYMKFSQRAKLNFWTMANESTAQIKQLVRAKPFVTHFTVFSNTLDPDEYADILSHETAVLKSSSYQISSFGSFDLESPQIST